MPKVLTLVMYLAIWFVVKSKFLYFYQKGKMKYIILPIFLVYFFCFTWFLNIIPIWKMLEFYLYKKLKVFNYIFLEKLLIKLL